MPSESEIPIASQGASRRFATRLALFYGATFGMIGTHLPFFTVWLKAVGIDAWWIGVIGAVPSLTRFTILPFVTSCCGKVLAARGADRDRAGDRARLCRDRHPASAARRASRLCRHLLAVDADDAADGRLCAPRRGALRPELRAVAAVGLGGLRGGGTGLRHAGRHRRGQAPDLGHRGLGAFSAPLPASGCSRSTVPRPRRRRSRARARCCAIAASSPSSSRRP